jgi:hypothetical protein
MAAPSIAPADLILKSEFSVDAVNLTEAWLAQHDLDPSLEMVDASRSGWKIVDLDTGVRQGTLPIVGPLSSAPLVIPDSDGDGLDEIVVQSSAGMLLIEGATMTQMANVTWPGGVRTFGQCDGDPAVEVLLKELPARLIVLDAGSAQTEASHLFTRSSLNVWRLEDLDDDGFNEVLASCDECGDHSGPEWYLFDTNGTSDAPESDLGVILPGAELKRTVPEPSANDVEVTLALAEAGPVSLRILDVSGRLVRSVVEDLSLQAGEHRLAWDGLDDRGNQTPSGVYFAQVTAGNATDVRRITLVR